MEKAPFARAPFRVSGDGGGLRGLTSRGTTDATEHPFARGWDVDQDPVADPGVRQAIRLVHPPANRTRLAFDLGGERLEISKICEQFIEGHFKHLLAVRVTVLINLLTEIAVSKKCKTLFEFALLELSS
jgi:hypothetical protein